MLTDVQTPFLGTPVVPVNTVTEVDTCGSDFQMMMQTSTFG